MLALRRLLNEEYVKQLKIRDLNQAALDIVFHSLVLNKITYASQSFSGYLLEQHTDRLQAILNKAKKWGLVSVFLNVRDILENQYYRLFRQVSSNPRHSLNTILPDSHQLEALPLALVTAVILTRCLAVSITYIINPLLIDASLSTYESNHKTRYAVSALIM